MEGAVGYGPWQCPLCSFGLLEAFEVVLAGVDRAAKKPMTTSLACLAFLSPTATMRHASALAASASASASALCLSFFHPWHCLSIFHLVDLATTSYSVLSRQILPHPTSHLDLCSLYAFCPSLRRSRVNSCPVSAEPSLYSNFLRRREPAAQYSTQVATQSSLKERASKRRHTRERSCSPFFYRYFWDRLWGLGAARVFPFSHYIPIDGRTSEIQS